jgi:hypothetical protein
MKDAQATEEADQNQFKSMQIRIHTTFLKLVFLFVGAFCPSADQNQVESMQIRIHKTYVRTKYSMYSTFTVHNNYKTIHFAT